LMLNKVPGGDKDAKSEKEVLDARPPENDANYVVRRAREGQ